MAVSPVEMRKQVSGVKARPLGIRLPIREAPAPGPGPPGPGKYILDTIVAGCSNVSGSHQKEAQIVPILPQLDRKGLIGRLLNGLYQE